MVEYIDLKQCILEDNVEEANVVRQRTADKKVFLWNLMSSPGAGKTTFLTSIISKLQSRLRFAVVEADIESTVDAERIAALGIPTVQLRTGGFCHLDATMTQLALDKLDLDNLDVVVVENVGNLVCPAEFDIGADIQTMILSVPEGDDKAIKYPLMFSVCEALIVSKIDTLSCFDFDFKALERNVKHLNADLKIFPLSAKTNDGMDAFVEYIYNRVCSKKTSTTIL